MKSKLLKKDELGIALVLKHADKDIHTCYKPSTNTLTCWYFNYLLRYNYLKKTYMQ